MSDRFKQAQREYRLRKKADEESYGAQQRHARRVDDGMHDASCDKEPRPQGGQRVADAQNMLRNGERREDGEVLDRIAVRMAEPVGPVRFRPNIGLRVPERLPDTHFGKPIEDDRHPEEAGERGCQDGGDQFGRETFRQVWHVRPPRSWLNQSCVHTSWYGVKAEEASCA